MLTVDPVALFRLRQRGEGVEVTESGRRLDEQRRAPVQPGDTVEWQTACANPAVKHLDIGCRIGNWRVRTVKRLRPTHSGKEHDIEQ